MKTLVDNIARLVAVPPGPVCGADMNRCPVVPDAAVVIDGDRIGWFGPRSDKPAGPYDRTIDAAGGTVTPGLVDCHTHVVFAGSREAEFAQRIAGASYIEILEAGGGIKSSVRMLREASLDDLVAQSEPRLRRMIECGATTVEIKSGYGLSPEHEIKTLEAVQRLNERLPIDLIPTFLGAHVVPPEYEERPDAYIDAITEDGLIDRIVADRLAEFADVFCERGAFTLQQSRTFLTRCAARGLVPKIHGEQITNTGSARLAAELGAASVDHLECIDDESIAALCRSAARGTEATIPVLLPGCSFFLGSPPAPARRLIDAGLPVALATDCNPGSAMIESLGLIMSMAATLLGMTPLESLVACTANAAAAVRRADTLGAVAVGHLADLLILDIPNIDLWPYRVGVNPVRTVIKRGRVIVGDEAQC